jgi:hypothetical protein
VLADGEASGGRRKTKSNRTGGVLSAVPQTASTGADTEGAVFTRADWNDFIPAPRRLLPFLPEGFFPLWTKP